MDSLLIALMTAIGLWGFVLTTPLRLRMHIMWFSWFIDLGFAALLILIFHGSTQGMIIACLGGFFVMCLRLSTLAIDEHWYHRKPLPPWQCILDLREKIQGRVASDKDQRDSRTKQTL